MCCLLVALVAKILQTCHIPYTSGSSGVRSEQWAVFIGIDTTVTHSVWLLHFRRKADQVHKDQGVSGLQQFTSDGVRTHRLTPVGR